MLGSMPMILLGECSSLKFRKNLALRDHDKHYAGYVAKLAELTEGTRYADMSLEEIVRSSDGAIFNNAAQALNHVIYFEQLAPKAKHRPSGRLLRAIDERFGSLDELKKRMTSSDYPKQLRSEHQHSTLNLTGTSVPFPWQPERHPPS